jgi:uncharacterized membrane-anchored protein YhcB (DUF1043 family)
MDKTIVMSIVEFIAGLVLEGIILGMIFQQISNRSQDKQEKKLQEEMNKIEIQNRKNTEVIQEDIRFAKIDLISQIKESTKERDK